MNNKLIDRAVAGIVFLVSLVLYLLTVSPTASFWDAGEFIAIAHGLQVSHPPGAPFYMLVGRLFSMFVPTEYVALSVNLISVLASALTVLLTHLIIVRLTRQWLGHPDEWTPPQRIIALVGGAVGALTFAVTDSFWFNAVEAEVYALSMFFTAIVVWLIMKWSEQAEQEEISLAGGQNPFGLAANRYLILIAYMFGLAIGVHLLNLLAVFFVALIVFFQEFERPDWTRGRLWTGIVVAGIVSSVAFLIIYPGIIQFLPDLAGKSGAPILFIVAFVALVVFSLYYTQKQRMQIANLVVLCVTMVLIGYSTYALIFIRSAADPPIDENDPETAEAIVSYLKREQYGSTPLFSGVSFNNRTGRIDDEKLFPRRYSSAPEHTRIYAQYDSDMEFFWKYQVGHMYIRYFLWNFVGKASDVQDSPAISGLIPGETKEILYRTPSERESRNAYYALPLLLGLIGAGFHFMKDWRRAFSVLVLFLVTGVGIIVYLNQTPMQPRERDYSYVASFFAFSLWIGIGASGILQLVLEGLQKAGRFERGKLAILAVTGAIIYLAVPFHMTVENYFDHDRSGNYVAPEYAYNMLMSLDENAVIFTNGDNDTFPLWYLQEVEGIRTDVRVVNLSLLNTPWYIKQLKNQWSHESPPVPISLTDAQIDQLGPIGYRPQEVSLPVNREAILGGSEVPVALEDTARMVSPMTWRLEGRPYNAEMNWLHVSDQVSLDILRTNAEQNWQRPIYFAVTVSRDGQLDLQNYFQLEGQAWRVVPVRHDSPLGRVVPSITLERLKKFKFTNLDNPNVYFDENIRRMVDNYRNIFAHTADELSAMGRRAEAVELLDNLLTAVPFETIPGDERSYLYLARAYEAAGNREKVIELWKGVEPVILHRLAFARSSREIEQSAQFVQMIRYAYMDAGDFDAASAFSDKLADVLGNDSLRKTPQELQQEFRGIFNPLRGGSNGSTVPPGN